MAGRPILNSFATLFLAGSAVLLFFILLSGVKESSPLDKFFFIEFETTNIQSSEPGVWIPNPVRWTPYNYCAVDANGHNTNCTETSAAFAFTPQDAFKTTTGIPEAFINNRDTYYYLSRIPYGFYLAVLFFIIVSLFFTIFGCCSRLGAAIASAFTFFALLFGMTSSALYTAVFVLGRNKFTDSGVEAHLGVKVMAFMWTITALLLLSFIILTVTCCSGDSASRRRRQSSTGAPKRGGFFARKHDPELAGVSAVPDPATSHADPAAKKPGFFFFKRSNSAAPGVDPLTPNPPKTYESSFERTIDRPTNSHPMSAGFFKINKRKDEDSLYAEN